MAASFQRVELSSLDRVLWPEVGMTKRQMLRYYETVADVIVPHLGDRPLTMGRFPTGVHEKGWYQTNCRGAPSWLEIAEVPQLRGDKVFRMCLVNDGESLMWVANQGTIELHPYLSLSGALDEPVALVFDLDPGPGASIVECCRVAQLIRARLIADGLMASVKTSGSAGLHLFVGLATGHSFAATREYALRVAGELARDHPRQVVSTFAMDERAGRVLIDWRQNEQSRSMIAPYSLRATPWPLVSTPVTWDEIEEVADSADARALFFGPGDVVDRLTQHGDVFASVLERSGDLSGTLAPRADLA
jgi:bifunctional non-homologous end joining protein LigD